MTMRHMHHQLRYLFLLCALLLAPALHPSPARADEQGLDPALAEALGRVLDEAVAPGGAPGALLSVAIPGQGTWSGARGVVARGAGPPAAPDTLFGIASISKLFVATVALQLVQEGWLSLDQTAEGWLPGLVPGGSRITVRHLLGHTSGLRDYLDEPFMRVVLANPGRVWSPRELVAAAGDRLLFAPGARWSYSNTNYVVLGLIVEQVTHNSLAREIHQRIIDPLRLTQTFVATDEPVPSAPMRGYEGRRDVSVGAGLSFAWGAGHIVASTADLARFGQALLGGELLGPESMATMQRFVGVGSWGSPELRYGLGLMRTVLPSAPPATALGHTGALAGMRTALWVLPGSRVTIAVALSEMSANPDPLAARVLDVLGAHGVGV